MFSLQFCPDQNILSFMGRKRRKKQHIDGESEFSGSLRLFEGTEDKMKEPRRASFEPKDLLDEQVLKLSFLFLFHQTCTA